MLGRVALRRHPGLHRGGGLRVSLAGGPHERAWTCRPQRRPLMSSSGGGNELVAADPAKYGAYCVDLVRQHDYDAFLCGLLVPRPSRRAFFALRAFNVETAMVKDIARGNALPAQMRMQWWREVVAGIYSGGPGSSRSSTPPHPVARALGEAVAQHNLTRRWLDRVLEARMKDLDSVQPATMAEVEEYAEYTASSLLYLTLESLGVRHATADHAASHAGKATGIATLLRGTRYHASQQTVYVPLELQRAFKLSANDLLRGPSSPEAAQALSDAFYEMASQAHLHLEHARDLLGGPSGAKDACATDGGGSGSGNGEREPAPSGTVTALLPTVRTAMYLEALQKAGFDAMDDSLMPKSHFRFQLRVLWAHLRGRI